MPALDLTNEQLLEFAKSSKIADDAWAKMMTDSKESRKFYKKSVHSFFNTRFAIEIGVKAAVTITLGVGLFFAAPATLLYGAALTLSLSSLIFSLINLNKYTVEADEKAQLTNFNADAWKKYRQEWIVNAQNFGEGEKQKALHVNMLRVGMALVLGFAAFTAVSSGLAIPLAISSILFSGSLFHRGIDEAEPYHEEMDQGAKLPSLTPSAPPAPSFSNIILSASSNPSA